MALTAVALSLFVESYSTDLRAKSTRFYAWYTIDSLEYYFHLRLFLFAFLPARKTQYLNYLYGQLRR